MQLGVERLSGQKLFRFSRAQRRRADAGQGDARLRDPAFGERQRRRHGDFALAAVAVTLTVSDGTIAQARIALTGVGPTALRAETAESRLIGHPLEADMTSSAIDAVRAAIEPETDLHASADYRRHLAGVLTGRALAAAWRRASARAA